MKEEYTNKQLANDRGILARRYYPLNDGRESYVEKADVNIAGLYEKEKSLKNLHVKGIGSKTKEILELILEKGLEKAIKISDEKRNKQYNEEIKNSQVNANDFSHTPDNNEYWENSIF